MALPDHYKKHVIDRPWFLISALLILSIIAGLFSRDFKLDASGESLILENDKSLSYYRKIREKYGADDFLVITYSPYGELLSDETLESLKRLRENLTSLDSVESVISILDVPVIYTTGVKLSEVEANLETIDSGEVDKADALNEFLTNPFYKDLLISDDGKTTALQVNFHPDTIHTELIKQRNKLQELIDSGVATAQDKKALKETSLAIKDHNSKVLLQQEKDVSRVRNIMEQESHKATLYLGGIPMITTDMIRYIRHDLVVFGGGVITFLVIILFLFFRDVHWIILPLFSCTLTGILALGYLGMMDWRVTVISSNFLSIY